MEMLVYGQGIIKKGKKTIKSTEWDDISIDDIEKMNKKQFAINNQTIFQ